MRNVISLLPAALVLAAAQAVHAQQDPLTLSAGYTLQSDSNLFRLPANANVQNLTGQSSASETIGVTTVGLGFNTRQSLQTLSVNLDLVDYQYQKFSYLSFTANNYNASWQWAITPRVTGTFSTDRKETLNSFADFTGYRQRNQRLDTTTRFDATIQLDGPWRLIAGASTTRQENQLAQVTGSDFTTNAVDAGVRHVFSSGSSLSYQMRVGKGNYLNRTVPNTSALDDQYTQIDNDLRLRWDLGGGTSASANLTHINRTHPLYGQRDYSGFNTGAGLNLALSGKTSINLAYSHVLDAYAANNSNYSSTDRISVGPVWQVSPKVGVRFKHEWAQRSYLGSPTAGTSSNRQDITRDTTLSVNWQPHDQLALSAALQSASRGVNQAGLDYDSTMLLFTAQLTY
ncbi:XrtB/PEP-CTERM-associated polysaccharide biosynthesis outer membrane protein EpsL [Rhodoferax mekongensis]|uniref:XrtB/PEP-CTERM-associated polysaccharide biosynthesis outer membrane protein EpsL n=1 Tax=Rhodoferax mekongensis TaxID=3068341 RepID=UPI0028BE96FB|nr:XrtB/PEP-CTERM-associated polysaccharide biosynthesis outer membrane protein EpsL [Rhodoferax sp. TBRC 17199]MDT7516444.1 putative exosortase B-associated extracellular polysaccharide biosynthesis transporter EpsL [Rhodoferax sp. TBRC 17199]